MLREKGAVVLGVSKDSVESHKRFEEKHGLPFPFLADEDAQVITAYDVMTWQRRQACKEPDPVNLPY